MRPDEFVVELDTQDLEVENDLLMHEVAYLRGQLSRIQERAKAAEGRRLADTQRAEESLTKAKAELASARKDLRWILGKLDQPPIGWLLRRRAGFRSLAARWGTDQRTS